MNLKHEQRRLFALLPMETHCFVKLCDDDRALWVSDLPRRADRLPELQPAGFQCEVDERSRLWYIDWTEERRRKVLDALPTEIPAFPAQEAYHEAYALCRWWLIHPGEWNAENAPVIRRVLKLTAQKEERMLTAVPALMQAAAQQWRVNRSSAYPAGQVLCEWLDQRKEKMK